MRKFAIVNSLNESYELNDIRNFFHSPGGLGFTRNTEFAKIGNTYEIIKEEVEQPTPTGQICFKDEPQSSAYAKYGKFVRFLAQAPLTLIYKSDKNHKIDVAPQMIDKGEISRPLGLNINITFKALSLWYDEVEKDGTDTIEILSDSAQESACHIEICGTLSDPTWIQKVDGEQIAAGQVTASLSEGDTLHIRSDTNPYQIYKVDENGIKTDLYASSNFSTQRFFTLKYGDNVIKCEGATKIKVTARLSYETV